MYLMDIKTVRWRKARQLVEREGGISRFAERVGRTQQQANQFAGPNPTKGIGNKIARLIEQSFGLDHGYLDKMESREAADLSVPASNSVEAIRKASQAAEAFVEARKNWLTTRPQALYMVRSDLRKLMIEHDVEIQSESDDGFIVSRSGRPLRVDLHVPLPGFTIYRYESTYSMELPDVLVIPVCKSATTVGFYLVPKYVLEKLPGNTAISLNTDSTKLNNSDISKYLDNLAPLI